jgi:hypothetical protein
LSQVTGQATAKMGAEKSASFYFHPSINDAMAFVFWLSGRKSIIEYYARDLFRYWAFVSVWPRKIVGPEHW